MKPIKYLPYAEIDPEATLCAALVIVLTIDHVIKDTGLDMASLAKVLGEPAGGNLVRLAKMIEDVSAGAHKTAEASQTVRAALQVVADALERIEEGA